MSLFDHPKLSFFKRRSGPPRGVPENPWPAPPHPQIKIRVRGADLVEPRVLVRFDLHGCKGPFPECYEAFPTFASAKEAMDKWEFDGQFYGSDSEIVNAFYKAGDEIGTTYGTPNPTASRFDPTLTPAEQLIIMDNA